MPPRTRGIKANKPMKENIDIIEKKKVKLSGKNVKPTRTALSDKTNSASDDNASIENPKNPKIIQKEVVVNGNAKSRNQENYVSSRPRRERKLPNCFEDHVMKNLSKIKDSDSVLPVKKSIKPRAPVPGNVRSPFKTPEKCDNTSLLAPRPTRVSRLPSRFEDHSISPHKFIPVQPLHSSTPTVLKNNAKKVLEKPKLITSATESVPSPVKSNNKENNDTQSQEKSKLTPAKNCKTKTNTEVTKKVTKDIKKKEEVLKTNANSNNNPQQGRNLRVRKKPAGIETSSINDSNLSLGSSTTKSTNADSNNNPQQGRNLRVRKKPAVTVTSYINDSNLSPGTSTTKSLKADAKNASSPKKKIGFKSTLAKKCNTSFKLLENKKQPEQEPVNKEDIYDFTFDPDEEPPPQKKKRKRVVKKKPRKPKTVIFKNTYDYNISKALSVLKTNVAKKPVQPLKPITEKTIDSQTNATVQSQQINLTTPGISVNGINNEQITTKAVSNVGLNLQPVVNSALTQNEIQTTVTNTPSTPIHNSVRIEDIVLDFQDSHNQCEIDYSPVNSPRPKTPIVPHSIVVTAPSPEKHNSHDALNLRDSLSFFDDQPVANSSMNVSSRHPHASPWRVDYQSLPIKWHVNSYVKPNMTPAVECSFVNYNDSNKKKHVYTNLVPESHEELPEIVEKDPGPNLIQTSIISFIKEVAEKSAQKKRGRSRSTTPAKLFNDLPNNDTNKNPALNKTPRKLATPNKNTDVFKTPSKESSGNNNQSDKDHSREHLKRKCNSNENPVPVKTPRKNMDNTYFGFDDTDDVDQENVLPQKVDNPRARALRPRARAVLKEINEQSGPVRANIPLAAKSAALNSDTASKLYEQMKSATDAPVFPEENAVLDVTDLNNDENRELNNEEDSQSVHLFEDIEEIHHFKQPHRKSYGKAKKVAFVNPSDSETQDSDLPVAELEGSSEEDDLHDLTFEIPAVEEKKKRKKLTKKQKMTKKEEAEAEAWAAGFNSMCEEVEDFPLVVE